MFRFYRVEENYVHRYNVKNNKKKQSRKKTTQFIVEYSVLVLFVCVFLLLLFFCVFNLYYTITADRKKWNLHRTAALYRQNSKQNLHACKHVHQKTRYKLYNYFIWIKMLFTFMNSIYLHQTLKIESCNGWSFTKYAYFFPFHFIYLPFIAFVYWYVWICGFLTFHL